MKPICKNCKYWTPNDRDFIISEDEKYSGDCHNPKFVYRGDGDIMDEDGLGYWDHEGCAANFVTGAEFGCKHFEPKQ